ncbi:NUDIX hydrolase [Celeribacter arenosi]|uniref:NUDIX hydrolase n=1 Tax=Celeribacter arenosi TaxID=792649 RepID=A0ABP7JVT0_9RHOB
MSEFDGAKIAILRGDDVLTLQRDDIPTIPFPGEWDLPGGGREGHETPFETVARELHEELGLRISAQRVIYHREEDGHTSPDARVHFFVATWEELRDEQIVFGDEGQGWCWMRVTDFIARPDVVAPLRQRMSRYLFSLS